MRFGTDHRSINAGYWQVRRALAEATALAELKYVLQPQEIVELNLEQAMQHPRVMQWAHIFADNIGNPRVSTGARK